jgi:DNA-binding transcriptional MerR regulator
MSDRREFSTLDIVKLLDIPRERLRVWIDKGYIKPSLQTAEKQGEKHLFSVVDLYTIEIFKYLIERGYNRERASEFTQEWVKGLKTFGEDCVDYINTVSFITRTEDGKEYIECSVITSGSHNVSYAWEDALDGDEWVDFIAINFDKIRDKIMSAIK